MSFVYKVVTVVTLALMAIPSVFAQAPENSAPPAFIQNIKSQEDYDKLTPEQKFEEAEYFKDLQPVSGTQAGAAEGSVSCFDYYKFGSVQVNLTPTLGQTVPGATLTFTGDVTNENAYPVVDGSVYVKIFYSGKDGDDEFIPGQGYPVVDEFSLPDTYVLPANGSKETMFSWKVPENAQGGEYMAAFFFQTAKRFNLLGLSFTDDVTGNQTHFSVTSDNKEPVRFDKSSVTLNGRQHAFAAFPLHFEKGEAVKVSAKLTNYTNIETVVPVTWKLYAWDSLRAEMLKETVTESITLKPNETKELSYNAKAIDASVSYLVVEADDQESKSILNIRWIQDGVEETRINFPSITKYPLTEGEQNTLFSCVHSTNLPSVKDSVLTLTLKDKKGEVIHTYKYTGDITSAMMGVKSDFVPEKTLTNFTLSATLERGGVILEEVSQTYDCRDIDPERCSDEVDSVLTSNTQSDNSLNTLVRVAMIILVVLSLVALLGVFIWKIMKKEDIDKRTETLSILFAFLISGTLLFGVPGGVEAKSVVSSVNNVPQLAQDWVLNDKYPMSTMTVPLNTTAWGAKWLIGLEAGASATVVYKTRLINNNTGDEIFDGASIPIGTNIRVERTPAQNSDIFWNGTGAAYDTPYGYWVAGAGPTARSCYAEDATGWFPKTMNEVTATLISYNLLDVAPSVEQIVSPSANLSCTGNICTVVTAGPVSVGMNFPQTYGRFYYRYLDHPEHYGGGCLAKNVPMRKITGCENVNGLEYCYSHGWAVEPNPYDLIIPAATITFNLTATGPNNPPAAPTVTPVSPSSNQGVPLNFTAVATDSDGDNIRYGFDWDNNGTVDEYTPAVSFVGSGVSQNIAHTWPIASTYTIKVRTEDDRGAVSTWTTKTVNIILQPTATLSGTNCTILVGQSTCTGQLTWSIQNAVSPNVYDVTHSVQYSTNSSETNFNQVLQKGGSTVVARDGTSVIKSISLSASCASGSYWNDDTDKCITTPEISIETSSKIVRSGETTDVTVSITSEIALTCKLYGTETSPETINHPTGVATKVTYPIYKTSKLTSDKVIVFNCTATGVNISKEARIGVVGVMQEL